MNKPLNGETLPPVTAKTFSVNLQADLSSQLDEMNKEDLEDPNFKPGISKPRWFKEVNLGDLGIPFS